MINTDNKQLIQDILQGRVPVLQPLEDLELGNSDKVPCSGSEAFREMNQDMVSNEDKS